MLAGTPTPGRSARAPEGSSSTGAIAAIITATDAAAGDRVDTRRGVSHPRPTVAAMGAAPALPVPPGLDSCRALLAYDDDVAAARSSGSRTGTSGLWSPRWPTAWRRWCPTSPASSSPGRPPAGGAGAQRGFDQAELLARAVARRRGLPCARLLRRRPGPPQAGPGRRRPMAPPGVRAPRRRSPPAVLLIDDVATTGPPSRRRPPRSEPAGAPVVHGLVVARAPARAPRPVAGVAFVGTTTTREACPWRSP